MTTTVLRAAGLVKSYRARRVIARGPADEIDTGRIYQEVNRGCG